VSLLAQAGLYLHTTVRGRVRVWRRELDRLDLRGNEHLLDVGCGRGAVLVEAAQRLPSGRASAWICGAATTRAATIGVTLADASRVGVP
jgi:cyclopropane fatty-acyl-phospholipid synthase-like methyltransferase